MLLFPQIKKEMVEGGYVGWWLEKGGSAMEEVVGHSEVQAKMGGYLMVGCFLVVVGCRWCCCFYV
jgi:hypothetical protein